MKNLSYHRHIKGSKYVTLLTQMFKMSRAICVNIELRTRLFMENIFSKAQGKFSSSNVRRSRMVRWSNDLTFLGDKFEGGGQCSCIRQAGERRDIMGSVSLPFFYWPAWKSEKCKLWSGMQGKSESKESSRSGSTIVSLHNQVRVHNHFKI